jgi:hypothetical protein
MTATSSLAKTLTYAGLLICACSDGPTGPAIPDTQLNPNAAQLNIGVVLIDTDTSDPDTLLVRARFFPGLLGGRLRDVDNDTLRVMGHALTSTPDLDGLGRPYNGQFPVDGSTFSEVVEIIPPVVAGVDAPQPDVRWSGIAKLGPDTLFVRDGEELLFRLDLPLEPLTPEPQFDRWSMSVEPADGFLGVSVSGRGLPLPIIPLPEDLRQVLPPGELNARFFFQANSSIISNTQAPPDGGYLVVPALAVQLQWVLVEETT